MSTGKKSYINSNKDEDNSPKTLNDKNQQASSSTKMFTNHIHLINICKLDWALDNLQWLMCHKTRPNNLVEWEYL